MNEILFGIGGAGLASLICYLYSRVTYWRDLYRDEWQDNQDLLDRAIAAETSVVTTEREMEFQRRTLLQLCQRDAVAVLTDQQLHDLAGVIAEHVAAKQTGLVN